MTALLPSDPRPRLLGSPVRLTCLNARCGAEIPTSRDSTAGRARLCQTCEAAATVAAQRFMTTQVIAQSVFGSLLRPAMPARTWPDA